VLLTLQKILKTMHHRMWRKTLNMALSTRRNIPLLRIPRQIPPQALILAQAMQALVPRRILAQVLVPLAHMQALAPRWIST
jgi:hypothetical protein